jgi:hypothetical protein
MVITNLRTVTTNDMKKGIKRLSKRHAYCVYTEYLCNVYQDVSIEYRPLS